MRPSVVILLLPCNRGTDLFLGRNMSKNSGNVVECMLCDLWYCSQESGKQRQSLEEAWLLGRTEARIQYNRADKSSIIQQKSNCDECPSFNSICDLLSREHTEKLLGHPGHLSPAQPLCILADMLWLNRDMLGMSAFLLEAQRGFRQKTHVLIAAL